MIVKGYVQAAEVVKISEIDIVFVQLAATKARV